MKSNSKIDMLNGPLFNKIILFSIPLILSGILQLLFNAADIVVVGQFSGEHALAAVGATSSLINLLINLFIGISVGASVVMGKYCGAQDHDNASKTSHTAMAIAIVCGILLIFVGVLLAKPMLEWMDTPIQVIDLSILYMRIYFLGMPAFMIYNFGAALLRAVGETKRPLYFLLLSGVVNVLLNLFFVIVWNMGVAGVAWATILSQYLSALLVVLYLINSEGDIKIHIKSLKIDKKIMFAMFKVGFPAGLQGVIFNISNILIQSSINSLGYLVVAGNTAASNIEGFVYTSMNAIYQTALSFTSQNIGAKQYHRIDKILIQCLLIVSFVGIVMGMGAYLLGDILLSIYNSDPIVIGYGLNRLSVVCAPYFLCGIMDVFVGSLRGMGYSIMPMIVSLTGACLFRVIWIFTIFATYQSQFSVYVSYPISWILTATAHFICYMVVRKKLLRKSLESV